MDKVPPLLDKSKKKKQISEIRQEVRLVSFKGPYDKHDARMKVTSG